MFWFLLFFCANVKQNFWFVNDFILNILLFGRVEKRKRWVFWLALRADWWNWTFSMIDVLFVFSWLTLIISLKRCDTISQFLQNFMVRLLEIYIVIWSRGIWEPLRKSISWFLTLFLNNRSWHFWFIPLDRVTSLLFFLRRVSTFVHFSVQMNQTFLSIGTLFLQ